MLSEMHVQRYTDITQQKQRWNDEIGPGHYRTTITHHHLFFCIYMPVPERANLLHQNQHPLLAIVSRQRAMHIVHTFR